MPGWYRDTLRPRKDKATVKQHLDELRARRDCKPYGSVENKMPYDKRCGFRSGGQG